MDSWRCPHWTTVPSFLKARLCWPPAEIATRVANSVWHVGLPESVSTPRYHTPIASQAELRNPFGILEHRSRRPQLRKEVHVIGGLILLGCGLAALCSLRSLWLNLPERRPKFELPTAMRAATLCANSYENHAHASVGRDARLGVLFCFRGSRRRL